MKKIIKGTVVSTKMNKTVLVRVDSHKPHPVYGKPIKSTKNFLARDNVGVVEGDIVLIEERTPLSKRVTWEVKERVLK